MLLSVRWCRFPPTTRRQRVDDRRGNRDAPAECLTTSGTPVAPAPADAPGCPPRRPLIPPPRSLRTRSWSATQVRPGLLTAVRTACSVRPDLPAGSASRRSARAESSQQHRSARSPHAGSASTWTAGSITRTCSSRNVSTRRAGRCAPASPASRGPPSRSAAAPRPGRRLRGTLLTGGPARSRCICRRGDSGCPSAGRGRRRVAGPGRPRRCTLARRMRGLVRLPS